MTFPSASASRPRAATGRPLARVAPRSRPPSNRSSLMPSGTRNQGSKLLDSEPSTWARRSSTCSRNGAWPLRRIRPVPTGSSANVDSASAASWRASPPSPSAEITRALPRARDGRGRHCRTHRADHDATYVAVPSAQRPPARRYPPRQSHPAQRLRGPHAGA